MKKVLIVLFAICILFTMGCTTASKSDVKVSFRLLDDDTYEIYSIEGTLPFEYEVPSEYRGKPVTSIGERAAYYLVGESQLTILIIPDSITRINDLAFAHHPYLREIRIGSNLQHCAADAFFCTDIDIIKLSSDNKTFVCEDSALIDPQTNTLVLGSNHSVIPNYIEHIGDCAFSGRNKLVSISIPDGCLTIGDSAFYNCHALRDVEIPNSIETIGDGAFSSCGITHLRIPGNISIISEYLAQYCKYLTSVEICDGVETIGSKAFTGCNNLIDIKISGSVKNVDSGAFESVNGLIIKYYGNCIPDSWDEKWIHNFEPNNNYVIELNS